MTKRLILVPVFLLSAALPATLVEAASTIPESETPDVICKYRHISSLKVRTSGTYLGDHTTAGNLTLKERKRMKPMVSQTKSKTTEPRLVRFFGLNTETPTALHNANRLSLIRIDEDEDRLLLFDRGRVSLSSAQLFVLSKSSPSFTMVEFYPMISLMGDTRLGGGGGTIRAGICEWGAD